MSADLRVSEDWTAGEWEDMKAVSAAVASGQLSFDQTQGQAQRGSAPGEGIKSKYVFYEGITSDVCFNVSGGFMDTRGEKGKFCKKKKTLQYNQ